MMRACRKDWKVKALFLLTSYASSVYRLPLAGYSLVSVVNILEKPGSEAAAENGDKISESNNLSIVSSDVGKSLPDVNHLVGLRHLISGRENHLNRAKIGSQRLSRIIIRSSIREEV